jgi:predicted NBD/HSP70 family sugar kinase
MTAHALQYLALAYDPDVIVIGGGVVQSSEILYQSIQRTLEGLANDSWVFRKVYSQDLVKLSLLGKDAGVLGAAALIA